MSKIEIALRLQLSAGKQQCDTCKARLHVILEAREGIEQIMLVSDGDNQAVNVSFCFEGEQNLDEIIAEMEQAGASVLQRFIQLPSALTGVADVYDARDAGAAISRALCSIEGIKDATISNRGIARIECEATSMNNVLRHAVRLLTALRNEHSNGKKP
jgi:hypothetical protein